MNTTTHPDELPLEVLMQFRMIFGSIRSHFKDIQDICGISGSQLWLLKEISSHGGIGISELASRISIHQTTCSLLADKLVKTGLIEKRRSEEDKRCVGLHATRKGKALLKQAPGPAEGLLPATLLAMPDTSLRKLNKCLTELINDLDLTRHEYKRVPLADM